ncbi:MAG: glycine oxidase ThiO [Isosphaeraceae bacterium]
MTPDWVIVGGGVIGLSVAYQLACEGVATTVLDRRQVGGEASWAGAGMIPANIERLRTNSMVDLRSWSAVLYPEWSASLLEETGIDNGFRRTGGVDVGLTEEEEQDLRATAGRWKREKIIHERLAPADFQRVEPALSREIRVAYFLPDRAQIRSPRHLRALSVASTRRGSLIRPFRGVMGFESRGERVSAVRTDNEIIPCAGVVLAAGAWTGALITSLGVSAPTPPLKGQIVLLRSEQSKLRRIVEHGKTYLVPREDGRVLVGSTEEDLGFDTRSTHVAVQDLIRVALKLCPTLAGARLENAWAGLRPGSPDTRPFIGSLPGYTNILVATGHKRAGLQLSPATAEVITDLVLGRPPRIDLAPFAIDRVPVPVDDEPFRS